MFVNYTSTLSEVKVYRSPLLTLLFEQFKLRKKNVSLKSGIPS